LDSITILKRSEKVSYKVVDGEAILLHLEKGIYFSLNTVGTDFWERLDGRQTIAQHAAVLAGSYNVEYERVIVDLLELAEQLSEDNLVESVG